MKFALLFAFAWATFPGNSFAEEPKDVPHPISMRAEYVGEDKRGIDPVFYIRENQIHQYEVKFDGGKLLDHEGKIINSYQWNLPSLYVITEDQKFYLSLYQKHNQFHHSSISGGKKVLSAGQILVKDGKVIAIDRQSGHYFPTDEHLQFAKRYLEQHGIDVSKAKTGYNTAEENVHLLKDDPCLGATLGNLFIN